jgi:quercetin dioxygenase-like cupin family protein
MVRMKLPVLKVVFAVFWILLVTGSLSLAQDPVKVAAGSYKVITENEQVRLLDINVAPGVIAPKHSHPDNLVVMLEPGSIKWTNADGTSTQSPPDMKRGSVMFAPAGTHASQNVGKTTVRAILIEFKKPAPTAGKGRNPSIPAPFKQVLDNSYVRVFEGSSSPGASMAQHTHGDHVTIALTDGSAEVTDKDGKKETIQFKKDTATFSGPVTHSAVNTGKTAIHLIDVELK